jgi:SHS2 domain-containing protein
MQKPKQRTGYRFLEHTADIMLEAYGKDYLEALGSAANGMFSVLGSAKPIEKFTVHESARTLDELVVHVLSNILSECDSREMVPAKTKVLQFCSDPPKITLEVWGEKKRPRDAIKAVTFHELAAIKESDGSYTLRVLFDV